MGERRWNQPGVPHAGWRCVGYVDRQDSKHVCQMCRKKNIRYVHIMTHEECADRFEVGCECALRMEKAYVGVPRPKAREREMENRAARREKWTTRAWGVRTRGNGGFKLKARGYQCVVEPNDDGSTWGAMYLPPDTRRFIVSARKHKTLPAAQLAIFDAIWPPRVSFGK